MSTPDFLLAIGFLLASCLVLSVLALIVLIGHKHGKYYHYQRGKLNGSGRTDSPIEGELKYHALLIISCVAVPIGLLYMLGWYLTKKRDYRTGWKDGKLEQQVVHSASRVILKRRPYDK